MIRQSKTIVTA